MEDVTQNTKGRTSTPLALRLSHPSVGSGRPIIRRFALGTSDRSTSPDGGSGTVFEGHWYASLRDEEALPLNEESLVLLPKNLRLLKRPGNIRGRSGTKLSQGSSPLYC